KAAAQAEMAHVATRKPMADRRQDQVFGHLLDRGRDGLAARPGADALHLRADVGLARELRRDQAVVAESEVLRDRGRQRRLAGGRERGEPPLVAQLLEAAECAGEAVGLA